jgi:predicted metal-binding membrane protein
MQPGPVLLSFTRAPWPLLFATAGLGLALCLYSAGHSTLPAFCGSVLSIVASWPTVLEAELALNPAQRMLADWALMLLAMMPPLLAMPLMHVWRSSLPRRRIRAALGFLLGYSALWLAAGPLLMVLALLLQLSVADAALATALLVALLWSASPWQRAALNRGHRTRRIGLFGWAADRDCLVFGASHGAWCIASCWAWMLMPLLGGAWHIPLMLVAGAIMLVERLAPGDRPHWHWPVMLPRLDLWLLTTRKVAHSHD